MLFTSPRHQTLTRDRDGRRVLAQRPNAPLIGWLVCQVLAFIIPAPPAKLLLRRLGRASLAAWSMGEITGGQSLARRLFGLLVARRLAK